MRRRLSALLAALVVILLTGGSGPASATHPGCYIDGIYGSYTDNQESFVNINWINWGAWDSTHDYIAKRYTQAWELTYYVWHSGSEGIAFGSTSGNQILYRWQSQQRAGYVGRTTDTPPTTAIRGDL